MLKKALLVAMLMLPLIGQQPTSVWFDFRGTAREVYQAAASKFGYRLVFEQSRALDEALRHVVNVVGTAADQRMAAVIAFPVIAQQSDTDFRFSRSGTGPDWTWTLVVSAKP